MEQNKRRRRKWNTKTIHKNAKGNIYCFGSLIFHTKLCESIKFQIIFLQNQILKVSYANRSQTYIETSTSSSSTQKACTVI